jgi:hypothetical protein
MDEIASIIDITNLTDKVFNNIYLLKISRV